MDQHETFLDGKAITTSDSFSIGNSSVSSNALFIHNIDISAEEGASPTAVAGIDFIFGYGSIINNASRLATINAALHGEAKDKYDSNEVAAAILSGEFGYRRSWSFRASTGFTALGIEPSVCNADDDGICGVLFPVPNAEALASFDVREVGYYRKAIPAKMITILTNIGSPESIQFAVSTQSKLYSKRIWVYIPEAARSLHPDEDFPIIQTYVDVCVRGCLEWGGSDFAKQFLQTTHEWSEFYLNDAPLSRRPWLHRPDYALIDNLLQQAEDHVKFSERKHPEEYASRHLTAAQGMWNVPSKGSVFINRESYLQSMQEYLLGLAVNVKADLESDVLSTGTLQLQLVGIGGVGKTQLATEYCYRHFGTAYGLIVFIRAETPAIIASEFRRFAVDVGLLGAAKSINNDNSYADSKEHLLAEHEMDDVEVVELVKRKLSRSRYRWLLVFDNMDDISHLAQYLPRGRVLQHSGKQKITSSKGKGVGSSVEYECGGGHVIITSRESAARVKNDKQGSTKLDSRASIQSSRSILHVECFQKEESLRYLELALSEATGISRTINEVNNHNVLQAEEVKNMSVLAETMGHLPLALAQAVAYVIRCDVTVSEYLERLNSLIITGVEGDFSIVSSLSITLERIGQESAAAYTVLCLLSFLSSDGITKNLLSELLVVSFFRNQIVSDSKLKSSSIGELEDKKFLDKIPKDFIFLNPLTVMIPLNAISLAISLIISILTTLFVRIWFESSELMMLIGIMISLGAGLFAAVACSVLIHIDYSLAPNSTELVGNSQQNTIVSSPHIPHDQLLFETDRVWEILKQFSIVSVHGSRFGRVGSIHRLHQAVIRSRYLSALHNIDDAVISLPTAIQQCVEAIECLWVFKPSDSTTWERCSHLLIHVQALLEHMILPPLSKTEGGSPMKFALDTEDAYKFALKLAKLLTSGASYSMIVLSKFDVSRLLLEAALKLQDACSVIDERTLPVISSQELLNQTEVLLQEAIAVPDLVDSDVRLILERSHTLHLIGKVLRIQGDTALGRSRLEDALKLRLHCRSALVADSFHELGIICIRDHMFSKAQKYLSDSLFIKRKLKLSSAKVTTLETSESADLYQLSVIAIANNEYDKAEELLECALSLEECPTIDDGRPKQSTETTPVETSDEDIREISKAATLQQLGRVALRKGQLSVAEARFRRALSVYSQAYGESKAQRHINVIGVRHQLGCCLSAMKRHEEASEQFAMALTSRELMTTVVDYNDTSVIVSEAYLNSIIEILLELQYLGQSEIECNRLDTAELHLTRQKLLCERFISSFNEEYKGSKSQFLHANQRKLELLVRYHLFALYSLKTISNRRQNRSRSKELSKEIQSLQTKYDQLLLKKGQATQASHAIAEVAPHEIALPQVVQLVIRGRSEVRRLAKCLIASVKSKRKASESISVAVPSFSKEILIDFLKRMHDVLNELACLQSKPTEELSISTSVDIFRGAIELAVSLIEKNTKDNNTLELSPEESASTSEYLYQQCDSLRVSLANIGIKVEDK